MKTKNYDKFLNQELTDTSLAAEYLSSAIQDGAIEEFLLALRNVAEAHGGIGALSEITNLNRQSMYKMLSEDGNPTLSSLITVLKAIGINLNFSSDDEKEAA
jgi:probable addiction module antidote protein